MAQGKENQEANTKHRGTKANTKGRPVNTKAKKVVNTKAKNIVNTKSLV